MQVLAACNGPQMPDRDDQRRILCEQFKEGMNLVNKATEDMRTAVAKETGLSLKSVNVSCSTVSGCYRSSYMYSSMLI